MPSNYTHVTFAHIKARIENDEYKNRQVASSVISRAAGLTEAERKLLRALLETKVNWPGRSHRYNKPAAKKKTAATPSRQPPRKPLSELEVGIRLGALSERCENVEEWLDLLASCEANSVPLETIVRALSSLVNPHVQQARAA